MLVPKDGEDNLPYDELDPCCQKEIKSAQHRREVDAKLRTVDRSLRRSEAQRGVLCLSDPAAAWRCFCCKAGGDYPLLAALTQRMAAEEKERETHTQRDRDSDKERDSNGEEDSDEDDDDLLGLDDVPLTVYEQERLQRVAEQQRALQEAQRHGLGLHAEEALQHVRTYLERQPSVPLVLHVYAPDSEHCALLDWLIAQRVSPRSPGTRFRRLRYFSALEQDPLLADLLHGQHSLSPAGSLLCFVQGKLSVCVPVSETEADLVAEDVHRRLLRVLERAHVLSSELPPLAVLRLALPSAAASKSRETENDSEDEPEEENRFCDDPDCTKRYAHEHVARRDADGRLLSTASFLQNNARGAEALAVNSLLRL